MLRKLFGKGKESNGPAAQRDGVQKLSLSLSSQILGAIGGAHSIPAMPALAQKAFQLALNPDALAQDFVDVILADEAMAARVLKIANSVYFDRGTPTETVEQAVHIIGTNELRSLLNATTLSDLVPSRDPVRELLWVHNIGTALIAREIAKRHLSGKESLAFLGGLMHDIGKLLLLQRLAENYTKIIEQVGDKATTFWEVEEAEFPFDHTQVGQLIAERWRFSEELTEVIRYHHDPLSSVDPNNLGLHHVVGCADRIAHALGIGHPKGFTGFQSKQLEELSEVWRVLNVAESAHKQELDNLQKLFTTEYDLYANEGS